LAAGLGGIAAAGAEVVTRWVKDAPALAGKLP